MPPLPLPRASFDALLLSFFFAAAALTSNASCPPFAGAPPYPFGLSPGRAHPSFQVRCASPHSTISINGLSFAVIRYDPNSTSLFLSPNPNRANCAADSNRFTSVPDRAIDFSGTPFRVSDASCSRLSLLHPCDSSSLPNCTRCPWECKLATSPARLFHGCAPPRSGPPSQQGCQGDVLDYLDRFLKLGIQVEWIQQDAYFSSCRDCEAEGGVCGFNMSDPANQFLCFRSQPPPWIGQFGLNLSWTALLCIFFVIAASTFAAVVIAAVVQRSRRLRSQSLTAAGTEEEDPAILFLHRHRLLPAPAFTYDELKSSTNAFDPKRRIGDGGFGSVYLGHLNDGRSVAVKLLHRHRDGGSEALSAAKSFYNEILILSSIDHPNLVRLRGYCSDPRGLLLVYDYVPNGTLADHLHGRRRRRRHGKGSLTWQVRVDVALQIALAMEYLHFSVAPAVVHRDIKSSNIFVEKDMRVKVGDFGMSRFLAETASFVCTGPQGTPGYLDPDYHRSFRLTEKCDVYSFGVVLLELVTGKEAVDRQEMTLADMAVARIQMGLLRQVVDPALADADGVEAVAELAFRCVAADKDDRPDAREVVAELRRIRARTRGAVGVGGGSSTPREDAGGGPMARSSSVCLSTRVC